MPGLPAGPAAALACCWRPSMLLAPQHAAAGVPTCLAGALLFISPPAAARSHRPLQGDYRLPAGALQREPSALLTLRQHLQDAAARAGRPPMARQRSTADLAPAGGTTAGTAGRAPGSGPAPIGLAAVWQSLDDSEL